MDEIIEKGWPDAALRASQFSVSGQWDHFRLRHVEAVLAGADIVVVRNM